MYLGKRKVEWKNKKVVISTTASKKNVLTGITIEEASVGHRHQIVEGASYTLGMDNNSKHAHKYTSSTVSVVSSSSSKSDQIVYLG